MPDKLIPVILVLAVVGLISALTFGVIKGSAINDQVTDTCRPTNMWVIGNRGLKTQVYDCSK